MNELNKLNDFIIVRGGGDIASGTIMKLYKAGFKVLILETDSPSAIRRNVAFSEAVYEGMQTIENTTCYLAKNLSDAVNLINDNKLAMLVDPDAKILSSISPLAVIDGILAKKNLGTNKEMAPITIALGPGFTAATDVDAVIETKRGHNLGRIIYDGPAAANTGIPGSIGGFDKERVIHSPAEGILKNVCSITDTVKKDQLIATIDTGNASVPVNATIDGLLRGLIASSVSSTGASPTRAPRSG